MTEINAILIFLAGGIIGFVICRIIMGTKPTAAQQQKLDNSKAELDHYKSQINKHFTSSAKLMGEVANSYQALYTHMAGQSQTLLSDSEADTLSFPLLKISPEKEGEEALLTKDGAQETAEHNTKKGSLTDSLSKTNEDQNTPENHTEESKIDTSTEIDEGGKERRNDMAEQQTETVAEVDEDPSKNYATEPQITPTAVIDEDKNSPEDHATEPQITPTAAIDEDNNSPKNHTTEASNRKDANQSIS